MHLASQSQPKSPDWFNSLQNLPREHGFEPLRVEGQIPADLRGTLFRNGPAIFSRFNQPYEHWFDADGAVSAVKFSASETMGAVRVVQTQSFKAETQAGKRLYGGFGMPTPGNVVSRILRPRFKNAANVSVLSWNERLFALYEGGLPTEISPDDLTTLGECDFDGMIVQGFSAHPHRVPTRRAMYNFGLRYGKVTELSVYELRDDGRHRELTRLALPYPTMLHDFIATEKHIVFFISPLRLRIARQLLGVASLANNFAWHAESGTEVIVIPIDDPTRVTRFTTEAFFQWHFCNAYERGGEIVVDLVRYPDCNADRLLAHLFDTPGKIPVDGQLCRLVVNAAQRKVSVEPFPVPACEFPRIAPSVQGQVYCYAYLLSVGLQGNPAAGWIEDHVAKLDVTTGQLELFHFGAGHYPSEPVFAPRAGAKGEDDGYVLTLVYDANLHVSYVAVLDARDITRGPLACAYFGHFIPFTLHGVWVGARIASQDV